MRKKEVLEEISLLENMKRQVTVKNGQLGICIIGIIVLFGSVLIGAIGLLDIKGENYAYAYGFAIGMIATSIWAISTLVLVKVKVFRKNGLEKITT